MILGGVHQISHVWIHVKYLVRYLWFLRSAIFQLCYVSIEFLSGISNLGPHFLYFRYLVFYLIESILDLIPDNFRFSFLSALIFTYQIVESSLILFQYFVLFLKYIITSLDHVNRRLI